MNTKKRIRQEKNDQLIFRYFNTRNFEIPKYQPFYIWSLQMMASTRCRQRNRSIESKKESEEKNGGRSLASCSGKKGETRDVCN